MIYAFDDFELDLRLYELRRGGRPCSLERQVFDVLAFLVKHHDRVVGKSELFDEVWGSRFVSEATLSSRLMAARKALGDSGRQQRYIKTVHGRGFRFVAPVRVLTPPASLEDVVTPAASAASRAEPVPAGGTTPQEIRLCTTPDGVHLAYATSGSGPPLVKTANWLSHLEFDWRSPVWRHWIDELSRDHTLVRYDERGCGLSDWDVDEFSLDAWVRDLESVVDTLGLERFPLLGISQGGPVAIAYASRHPERVTHLILYGTYALGRAARATTQDELDENDALITLIRLWWGQNDPAFRQFFARGFIPGGSEEQQRWFNDLCRVSASPENAARFRRAFGEIDVKALLPGLSVPTLVLHAIDDARVPIDQGRTLAASIPGARFVPLDAGNHILLEGEPAWPRFLAEVRSFLGVAKRAVRREDEALRTVLFTEIDGAAALSRQIGDERARSIAHRFEQEFAQLVDLHGGGEIKRLGDGVLASFQSAVRTVECAVAIQHAATRLAGEERIPFRVRAGIHTGDAVAESGDAAGGPGITASKTASLAAGGEIVVSDVVRQLLAGKGFEFSECESCVLEGLDRPMDVYRIPWTGTPGTAPARGAP
jgi:pimeloyl-ACP methyl ester carboxylesterase/DNA-binding winged helix-turn-helix (wHTH) protein/class 3 adenylate cyclase